MKATKLTKETIKLLDMPETNFPSFSPGDTISVSVKVTEGVKERIQDFEGVVIGIKGGGMSKTFRVRKISFGVAIERIFPYYSPIISKITFISGGVVRRAKLYYLRDKKGRDAVVEKRIVYSQRKKNIAATLLNAPVNEITEITS